MLFDFRPRRRQYNVVLVRVPFGLVPRRDAPAQTLNFFGVCFPYDFVKGAAVTHQQRLVCHHVLLIASKTPSFRV